MRHVSLDPLRNFAVSSIEQNWITIGAYQSIFDFVFSAGTARSSFAARFQNENSDLDLLLVKRYFEMLLGLFFAHK